eukprot:1155288-Pelagomonas_calceolata.AAC.2
MLHLDAADAAGLLLLLEGTGGALSRSGVTQERVGRTMSPYTGGCMQHQPTHATSTELSPGGRPTGNCWVGYRLQPLS